MRLSYARQTRIDSITQRRLALVPKEKMYRILDIGCGEGELTISIGKITDAKLYGIELDNHRAARAREKGISITKEDVNHGLPFQNSFFDFIFAGEIIEHVDNPDAFLQEIHRVLKPNGRILITTPNLASWHNRILLLFGIQPYGVETSTQDARVGFGWLKGIKNAQPAGHIHIFTRGALIDILTLHSFTIEVIKGCPSDFLPGRLATIEALLFFSPRWSSKLLIRARKVDLE